MKRLWPFIGILFLLVSLTGLGIYAFTPRHKLLNYIAPKLQVIKVGNLRVVEDQATFQLHLQVNSPFLPVSIQQLQYHFKLYDQTLCQGNQTIVVKSSGKKQPITLPIQLHYTPALSFIQRQVAEGVPVNADLQLRCQIPLVGSQTISRQEALAFTLPVLPTPEIINLEIEEMGFQHGRLILTLQVSNPNKFDYYLRGLSLNVQFPSYQAQAQNIGQDYLIKANQVTPIKIPSATALRKSDINTLFPANHAINYSLKTEMVLQPVQVAIDRIFFKTSGSGSVPAP